MHEKKVIEVVKSDVGKIYFFRESGTKLRDRKDVHVELTILKYVHW